MSGIYFSICGFIFIIIFIINFFSKRNTNNNETKLYKSMLIATFIGTGIDIFSYILYKIGWNINNLFYTLLSKMMLIYFIFWILTFLKYVYLISKKSIFKIKPLIFKILFILFSTIILCTSITFKETANAIIPTGLGVNMTYFVVAIGIAFVIVLIIENYKNIVVKKYTPIFLIIILLIISFIIQRIFPDLFLINFCLTIIVCVMYFTIENPDKKLLEEIHTSKKIADAANEDKSMLIYNMMNEVKSIASDINKSSEVILNSNNLEENRFFAREIISSNNKLYSMANNIYNIDVIDDINVKTVKNKYNIKLLLKEVISKNKELFEDKDISFRFNIDSNLPNTLYGDSINLKNVLNTIIGNSYKYTDKGYVELSVNAIFKKDIVRLIIKIEDSGIGIKAEDLDKCLNKNTKDQNSLYGARKTINIMGGNLLISSEYNKGTIVTIILDQKIYTTNKDNYDNYVNNKKILIIDDNNSGIKLISKILDKHNILYDSSNLGKEALDRIRKGDKYDLILLDEDMPYMNGISVMNKLNKIKGFDTKVMLLTKNSNIIYDDIYKDSGFSDYIIKPIDKDDLMNKINKYL